MFPLDRLSAPTHGRGHGSSLPLSHVTLIALLLAAGPALAQSGQRRGLPKATFDRALGEDGAGPSLESAWERLTPPEPPVYEDTGSACEAPSEIRLLTWNVGTVVPHTLAPWSLRLPADREAWVAGAIQHLGPEVVTLQEVQGLEQIDRLRKALRKSTGLTYSAVTTRVDPRRADGRMIATLYRGKARRVVQLESESGFRTHALVLPNCTVINVHGPSVSFANRKTFYADVVAWAKELPQPVIVAGDFNLGPSRGAGSAAVVPQGYEARDTDRDTFQLLRETFSAHTGDTPTTSYGLLLDHVMLTSGRVLLERVIPTLSEFPMDHYPLSVYLDLDHERSRQGSTLNASGSLAAGEVVLVGGHFEIRGWDAHGLIAGHEGITFKFDTDPLHEWVLHPQPLDGLDGRPFLAKGRVERDGEQAAFLLSELLSPVALTTPTSAVVLGPNSLAWPGQDRRVEAYGPGTEVLATAVGRRVWIKGSVELDTESGEVVGCYVGAVRGRLKWFRAPVYDDRQNRTGHVYGQTWLYALEGDEVEVRHLEWTYDADVFMDPDVFMVLPYLHDFVRHADRTQFSVGSKVAEADFPELSGRTSGLAEAATPDAGVRGLEQAIRQPGRSR